MTLQYGQPLSYSVFQRQNANTVYPREKRLILAPLYSGFSEINRPGIQWFSLVAMPVYSWRWLLTIETTTRTESGRELATRKRPSSAFRWAMFVWLRLPLMWLFQRMSRLRMSVVLLRLRCLLAKSAFQSLLPQVVFLGGTCCTVPSVLLFLSVSSSCLYECSGSRIAGWGMGCNPMFKGRSGDDSMQKVTGPSERQPRSQICPQVQHIQTPAHRPSQTAQCALRKPQKAIAA